ERAEAAAGATLRIRSPLTVGAAGGEWMPWFPTGAAPHLAEDQRIDDSGSLVFDSAPLERDLEILGSAVLSLQVRVGRPDGQVVVRLCDVAPGGSSARVTYAFLNLRHREGDERPVEVVPGQRYRIALKLYPTGYRFPAGHRLRLAVSTSYWPIIWPA